MKQHLVSVEKSKSIHCGFDLCPKKYKYLANPKLLAEIFTVSNSVGQKITQVKKSKHLGFGDDPSDSMRITECNGCNQKYLLRVDDPLCMDCRRIF